MDLNSHAYLLAQSLLCDDADTLRDFDVIPTWSSHYLAFGVMTPVMVSIEAIPYWQLYLPRFQALIKVDPGLGAVCLQSFAMARGENLCMIEKKFTEFNEIHTAEQVVIENMKKKKGKRKKS